MAGRVLRAAARLGRRVHGALRAAAQPAISLLRRRRIAPTIALAATSSAALLPLLTSLKLVCEIALLALAGQGVLHVLVGARREGNLFYQLLRAVARPFAAAAGRVLPAGRAQRLAAWVAFAVLAAAWLALTAAKIAHCLDAGMAGCR